MNKGELINAVAANGLTKKDAEAAINAVFGAIGDALAKGDSVQLIGFGTFGVKERAAREGRGKRTGRSGKAGGRAGNQKSRSACQSRGKAGESRISRSGKDSEQLTWPF